MKKKEKLSVYLVGAIEAEKDLGAAWRDALTPFLEDLDLEVLDPVNSEPMQLKGSDIKRLPEHYTDLYGEKHKPKHWHELKNAAEPHLYARFIRHMRNIIKYDIDVVQNKSDFLICYWTETTSRGAGTHSELTYAHYE
uniref:Uncharacterized protein n=1 Tax=Candidatus Kentrum sp. TUN TaxID=2126343 RepID=A0A451AF43_9GAMM|nr:MAG: hypothetical protein BECKTUN1418D_GA0071000_12791 [Candidatus Kentron sp. TUN]